MKKPILYSNFTVRSFNLSSTRVFDIEVASQLIDITKLKALMSNYAEDEHSFFAINGGAYKAPCRLQLTVNRCFKVQDVLDYFRVLGRGSIDDLRREYS